jgi:hypothetical protein
MKSHARSERLFSSRCVCVGKDVSLENARSSSETNYSKRTLEQQSEGAFENAFARTRARTFARSSRSDARLHSPENSFRSFKRFSLGSSSLRDKIKSDIRLPQNIQRFHVLRLSQRERERLNPSSFVASHHYYIIVCVIFKQKHRLNTRKEQSI